MVIAEKAYGSIAPMINPEKINGSVILITFEQRGYLRELLFSI